MKSGTYLRLYAFLTVSLVTFGLIGCGGDSGDNAGNGGETSGEYQPVEMKKVYDGPQIDESVSAEDGGVGFEEIAEEQGWKTGSIPEDQFAKYYASPDAKKGGMFTSAIQDYPAVLRPYGKDASTTTIQLIESLVYDQLIEQDPITLEMLPRLATHWKVSEDGQTYFFRLNPNAQFSDGYPLTTEDVLATYNLIIDDKTLDPFRVEWYSSKFDPPQALSKYVFSVRSKEKNWKNMLYFGSLSILPHHVLDTMDGGEFLEAYKYNMPPGTGPYVVLEDDIKTQSTLTLTRRSDWWLKDHPQFQGQYNFNKIKLVRIEEPSLQVQRFLAGELDYYLVNRAQWWYDKFEGDVFKRGIAKKRKIYNDNPQGLQGWAFNTRRAPLSDPRVREAIILLIDRQEMIDKIMHGEYVPMDSYFPNSPYENPNNPKYRYNPQRASELLAEAGYTKRNSNGILVNDKTGKPLTLELITTQGSDHIMTPVQQNLKRGGIDMSIRIVDFAQRIKLTNERKFDIAYVAYAGIIFPNPFGQLHSSMAKEQNTNNITGFAVPRADQLIDQELVTFDQPKRVKMLQELDSIFMAENNYALAWYAPFTRVVYWAYMKQPDFFLSKTGDYRDIYRYWWIDESLVAKVKKAQRDESETMETGDVDVMFWPDYNKSHSNAMTSSESGDESSDS